MIWVAMVVFQAGACLLMHAYERRLNAHARRLDRLDSATLNLLTSFEDHEERLAALENNKALRIFTKGDGR